ncbi:CAAX amino protease family protein [Streptococcus suis]|uniref:CAAX amino protease family protein n=1 Tax=Streptococcus suis TaxID=1307 RepID=A0A0Z8H1I8_STRSU|nr:type II CAAX endopeptidase family protein [Streptococcus suis]NQH40616.1 CPBP family intramembrane metalloprotease [Streptococcus suis]CYV08920.1 CAAX amino protease family protein [Streptococcus suis]
MVRKDRLFIAFIVLCVLNLLLKLHRYLGFSPIHSLYYQLASFVLLFALGIYHYRKLLWTDFGKMWSWKLLYQFPLFYLADFLVMYGGSFLQYLIVKSLHISEGIGNVTAVNKINQIVPLSIFLLIVGIIGPIVEELFYRKCLQDSLKNVLNPWFAIVLQGLIFGLGHAKSLDSSEIINTIPQICSGIYLGYLYHRTGNLCYPMLVHCVGNLSVGY